MGLIAHISDDGLMREESVSEHTAKTERLCREKGKRCGIANMMSLCAIIHDIGKNKKKFDEYIHAGEEERRRLRGKVAHASTGAKYIYDRHHGSDYQNVKLLTELIAYAAAAHHGLFDCIDIEQKDVFCKRMQDVEDFEEACDNARKDYLDDNEMDELFQRALKEFEMIRLKVRESCGELRDRLLDKRMCRGEIEKSLREYQLFVYAGLQRFILSVLIDSDWEATSDFMDGKDAFSKEIAANRKTVFEEGLKNFDEYMHGMQGAVNGEGISSREREIIDARNRLQRECREFAKNPQGIYCLPLPTGGGKTLSGLAYALQYCKEHPEAERIIYVSPYISITEQNADVFRRALGNVDWVLEHHSSVVREEEEAGEWDGRGQASRLDINWEEAFICTTFVQFMNALFSDKKQSIRLMHRLAHAVVIIDEVQSMPIKCVNTFNYMINFLKNICGTNIILCTATQPTLEDADCPICYSNPKYMIRNVDQWFEIFRRVEIFFPIRKYTFDGLKEEVVQIARQYRSILIVLNTKSAVRKLCDLLEGQDLYVEYLTTNLCAEHRSDKINHIKEMLGEGKNIVVVSTNLVEAGVDISFECVFRSIAGLDSLAQAAGRCNRNGEMQYGVVYLIELEDENTANMEELRQRIDVARRILHEYKRMDREVDILEPEWISKYYQLLYLKARDKMNFPLRSMDANILQLLTKGFPASRKVHIMNQAYYTAGREYRIIDDDSFGVIVPYRKGKEFIDSIQQARDFGEVKGLIRGAQRYTVNVRGSQLRKLEGMIQPVSERIPNIYMVSASVMYHEKYGLAQEWEPLII